jgi:asparagine synthase (glutamine-hydrolysing)
LGISGIDRSIDLECLAQFVRIQTILETRTLYRNIRTMMPGSLLTINLTGRSSDETRYWAMDPLEPYPNDEEAIESTVAAFRNAGRRMLNGSKNNGILLSGGVDSRMVLAAILSNGESVDAFTFGPALTDEGDIARAVASASNLGWHLVTQTVEDFWLDMEKALPVLQAQFSLAHVHTVKTIDKMAQFAIDSVYDGWGLDLFFAGSYLPRLDKTIWGRKLFIYRLAPLNSQTAVLASIFSALDIQGGDFSRSYLNESLGDVWHSACLELVRRQVEEISGKWNSPYDQMEKFFSRNVSRFRSYPVCSYARLCSRQRNPLFDSDVLDTYLRLPVNSRFMGRIYRQALRQINPRLANIPNSNTGTSLYLHPVAQGLFCTGRQFHRANRKRLGRILQTIGLRNQMNHKAYGSYLSPVKLVQVLAEGNIPQAATTRRALINGFLADNGIVDPSRLRTRLDTPMGMAQNEAWTILALASLAAWFERYPAEI